MTERTILPEDVQLGEGAWVAPGAVVVGSVTLEARASVWFGCVVRGDVAKIHIGANSNVQDLTLVHVDHGIATHIGNDVTIGHRCIIHGCEVGDGALIGMGATLLSGCKIGPGAVVAAGSLVTEGFEVPAGQLAMGTPARLRGPVSESLKQRAAFGASNYVDTARAYRAGQVGTGRFSGRRAPDA